MSYDSQFFREIGDDSQRSAEVIVPKFNELVKPTSVVDVGCGKGWFLAQFMKLGVMDVLGVDGAERDDLVIRQEQYKQVDLTQAWQVDRRFDLALSLEVAEHLPESAAETFVERLCALAPVVLFSAAIPMQGGHGHLNERHVDYWVAHFKANGYSASGWPRLDIWDDDRVAVYYRQNLLLFVSDQELARTDRDANWQLINYMRSSPAFSLYRFVHPQLFGQKLGVKFL